MYQESTAATVGENDTPEKAAVRFESLRKQVPIHRRLAQLPKYFGIPKMMQAEAAIYSAMRDLCSDYNGGYWEYYQLTNGGFYMSLSPADASKKFNVSVWGNQFEGELTSDAASIVACLFVYSRMSCATQEDHWADLYHNLRDAAVNHPEFSLIFRAID